MTATRCRPPTLRDLSSELTFEVADFCSGSIASIWRCQSYFRFSPNSRRSPEGSACLKRASKRHRARYSTTSPARASSVGEGQHRGPSPFLNGRQAKSGRSLAKTMPASTSVPGQRRHHSITRSARAIKSGWTSMPSALAVFKLITNSNTVGRSIGNSAGFSPFKTRST
jgi:hypothetical protein